jgi:hypothetical protein
MTGPIFDTHDIKLLVITGSIGMVLSMVFLSLSTGTMRVYSTNTALLLIYCCYKSSISFCFRSVS